MIAYVSGETARGALLRAGQFTGFILDSEEPVELSRTQLRSFFLNAWDVETLECESEIELQSKIESRWREDRALRLVLVAFDPKQQRSTRTDAARCADDFLTDAKCHSYVLNHLYSAPLPRDLDVSGVSDLISESGASILEDIFDSLVYRQAEVRNCVEAWENLPDEIFRDAADKAEMRVRVARTGAFYSFAALDSGSNNSLFQILADPVVSANPVKAREIVFQWASKYKEMPTRLKFEFESDGERWLDTDKTGSSGESGFSVFQRVKKQKATIKEELIAGNYSKAEDLIEGLIQEQKIESSREHLAKSLCDLATFSRSLGDIARFYNLSLRATEEAPSDAWAFVQLGHAHSIKGEFPDALDCYAKAEVLGDGRAALIGRAEALKYMGQKELALDALEECARDNPGDAISRGSRAALLAHFGHFSESLEAYDELVSSPLAAAHAFGGRAGVLNDLGRREEALLDQEMAVYLSDGDPIPYCAKAEMLREHGRFAEALETLEISMKQPHARLQFDNVKSRIYRDMGQFEVSERLLKGVIQNYPMDAMTKAALADLWRRQGRFVEALDLLLSVESQFPGSGIGRNSLAATYAALGKYQEAISYLPLRGSSSRAAWIAQHIRAMVDMKRGNWTDAEAALLDGLQNCPWPQQNPFFASSLASLQLRGGQVADAKRTLAQVQAHMSPLSGTLICAVNAHVDLLEHKEVKVIEFDIALSPLIQVFFESIEKVGTSGALGSAVNDDLFESGWSAILSLAA